MDLVSILRSQLWIKPWGVVDCMRWWIPSQGRSLSVCLVTNSVTNSVSISGRQERAWNFWSPQIELWCFLSLEMEPCSLWRYGTPLANYCTPNFLKFCLGVGVGSARSASLSTAAPQPRKMRSFFPRLRCCAARALPPLQARN